MDTSEKRPDLAMGRRPIPISDLFLLVSIEEVRLFIFAS
jgi:hypothetical protein